jgi:glycosyltransferase involved in cell wall biosynthesis
MSRPRVSVVIPARNAEGRLPRVLDALARQTVPPHEFEVLVVDDGSTDGTAEVVRRSGIARVLEAPPHGRQAGARNLGVAQSRASVLAFLDADCVPHADWIERGLADLDDLGADLLAGRIVMELPERPSPIDLLALSHDFDQERYASEGFSAGGNLWVRRAVFDRLGGFNTGLAFDEDREFALRATAGGAELRYSDAVVTDHPRRSALALARRSYRTAAARARSGSAGLGARLRSGPYVGRGYTRRRLTRLGHAPSRRELLWLQLAKYACVGAAGRWWAGRAER